MVPDELRYTREHEWVRVAGTEVTVGVTDFAARELGDVVFVELPEVGRKLQRQAVFGVVESVKAVSDLYAPVAGEVTAVNASLSSAPELVNSSPFEDGWMIRLEIADPAELDQLLDPAAYAELTAAD